MVRYNQHTTGRQVVQENVDKVDGKTIVITGPSEGTIGGTLLMDLAAAKPSKIFLVGRNLKKIQSVIDTFKQENTQTDLIFIQADLDDLESIARAGDEIVSKTAQVDILFNNAGVMATPYQKTKQGHEWQFGINHLAHFVLTSKLMPLIEAAAPGSAIINTSSTACEICGIPYDDLLYSNGSKYNPWASYGASKTANAQFTLQLHSKNKTKGIKCFAIQPGMVQTNIAGHLPETGPDSIQEILSNTPRDYSGDVKPLSAGTSTMLAAALDSDLEKYSGGFLRNCDVYLPDGPWVLDIEGAERLWRISEDLTGVKW